MRAAVVRRPGDTPAVEVSAIGRAEIDHPPSARVPLDRGMAARSRGLVQNQIVVSGGADGDALGMELLDLRMGPSQSHQPQRIGLAARINPRHVGEFSRSEEPWRGA